MYEKNRNQLQQLQWKLGEAGETTCESSWYRGEHCSFHPTRENFEEEHAIDKYVIKGWEPETPFITKDSLITIFGDCFAEQLRKRFINLGYKTDSNNRWKTCITKYSGGLANSFVIRQQIEWAFDKIEFQENVWYDKTGLLQLPSQEVKKHTHNLLMESDVIILSFGLTEVWYDKKTNEVFWGAVPKDKFNEYEHGFKTSTVEENVQNLEVIYATLRENNPNVAIILILCPHHMAATFRPVSCVTANIISKAILRAAIDEFYNKHPDDNMLFYFPAYEAMLYFQGDPFNKDGRHVRGGVIWKVMKSFDRLFCC